MTLPTNMPTNLPTTAPLCIYHKNCLDGRTSAAIVRKKLGPIECVPMNYGMTPPDVRGRSVVYIVDFGFPLEVMEQIKKDADDVIWIDHHETNVETLNKLGWGHFNNDESGASLTWKVLFPEDEMPKVVEYVRDRDLWRWELPHARAITSGLYASHDDSNLDAILEADLDAMRHIGEILNREQDRRVASGIRNGIPSSDPYGLRDKRALVVNSGNDLSEIGAAACASPHHYDICICYSQRGDGRWLHSLRSAGNVDCERIAANRGGGGHANAAAYVSDTPFLMSVDCLDNPY